MLKRVLLAGSAALFALAGAAVCQDLKPSDLATPHFGTWGFDTSGETPGVKPGDDFDAFANGSYIEKLTIPADKSTFGAFNILGDLSQARTRAILEDSAKTAGEQPSATAEKVGAFYRAFMDEKRIDGLGATPLRRDLEAIRAEQTRTDVARLMATAGQGFQSSIFRAEPGVDDKDPNRYIFQINQGGLGLPDRDYYLDAKFAPKLALYRPFVAKMLALGGWDHPDESAAAVVAFETRIAQAHWTRVQQRDPVAEYNLVTPSSLAAQAPGFDWGVYFTAWRVNDAPGYLIGEPSALAGEAKIFAETPISTLKAWQAFHLITNAAPYLSQPFTDARFDFYGKALSGQPQMQVRWKRASDAVGGSMGEAVGETYVARYFPPESKAKMIELVNNLKAAFRVRIRSLDWMSPATKAQALKKLDAYRIKIGYPDRFRDYAALTIKADDLYGDMERAKAFETERELRRIRRPVDKGEWGMSPQTVNAYNNGVFNEVVFPAAILQPPFFDPKADDAVNYGAIVAVIGHEMTHGFDDEGRHYDSEGRLRDWWTAEDAKKFDARADRLGKQYDTYEPVPGVHLQGKLTMGENIADQGGLSLALDAYHASLHGKPAPVIGGLTGDQRVFLGWAQAFREKNREDFARQMAVVDPHSPGRFRVNGVVRNLDAWYVAFNVQPGDKLYVAPADRAKVW